MNLFLMPVIVLTVIIALIAVLIITIIFFIIYFVQKRKKNKHKKIDDDFINNLLSVLGESNNILKISVDNARLKFDVKDLSLVNLESLKSLSQNGVFVTSNHIKTLFKYDSKQILNQLERRIGEKKV